MNDDLDKIIEKYLKTRKDENKKFEKLNVMLPRHIFDDVLNSIDEIKQTSLSPGIYTSFIIDEYLRHVEAVYGVNSERLTEENANYVKQQLPLTVIPETVDTIEDIKRIIGAGDRATVIRNAIEHYYWKY